MTVKAFLFLSRVQLNEAQDELMKKKELLEDLEPENTQTCKFLRAFLLLQVTVLETSVKPHDGFLSCLQALKVEELTAALRKKDDDMRAMEERYKMYLEKARNVSPFEILLCFTECH